MKNINDIKKIIKNENVKFYNVGLPTEVLINGIDLFNTDSFIDFIHSQKINIVFESELFDEADDYLITEEIIISELGKFDADEFYNIINEDIQNYNKKVLEIDFNIPFLYIITCLYEGKYFYIKISVDRGMDDSFLVEPEKKLQEIVVNNKENILNKRQENRQIIESLKKELKEIIINDEKFLRCTNRNLRVNYIKDLLSNRLDERFEPLKKLWIADTIKGIYQEPIELIELIWREIKNK